MEEKENAVEALLKASAEAKKFGLGVVDEDFKKNNHFHKTDPARPKSLLSGVLVRDEGGIYRNGEGGIPVIEDKAESLVLKNKSVEGYQAVMELARAKGWTAIELSGKPAMMSAAWIEAQLMGIEVKNYTPTKEDQEKLAARLITQQEEQKAHAAEKVEIHHFAATERTTPAKPTDINTAPQKMELVEIPPANIQMKAPDLALLPLDALNEPEAEQYELYGEEYHDAKMADIETEGEFSGKILSINNGIVKQKTGRSEQEIAWHKVENLSRIPNKGEVLDIKYKNGKGIVPEMDLSKAKTKGR